MDPDFKRAAKKRLLVDMLSSVKAAGGADWSVLIMDAVTTRVMSSACRISDVLDYGVSLVDNLVKRREALPHLAGVYFVTPTEHSARLILEDWKVRAPYRSAHIFFSSAVPPAVLDAIRACPLLIGALRSLKEVNHEFVAVDARTFLTSEQQSLQSLFGAGGEAGNTYRVEVATIATRLATVFAALNEAPAICFRAGKPPEDGGIGGGAEACALVAQRVALEVAERVSALQRSGRLPAEEACDLIVVDRGFDAVSPVIHEWTYEAMAYDLLGLEGSVFQYTAETASGKAEPKEHLLDERDELWVELRHKHFGFASQRVAQLLDEFRAKNRAASYKGGAEGGALDMRAMRGLVASLPQYREQLARLAVHVEIASRINKAIEERALVALGKLEQDLVFGDATSKEVIAFLAAHATTPAQEKLRLLMCYAATHPDKLDSAKLAQWQKLAKLGDADITTLTNLECLGVPVLKRSKPGRLAGLVRKRNRAVRKDRGADEDEEQWALSRFVPMVQELVEDLAAGTLSADDYPPVRAPDGRQAVSAPAPSSATKGASVRSVRSQWVTKRTAPAGGLESAGGSGAKAQGRRVVVFVVGGITRSEMRAAHKLSAKLGRPVLLGGTALDSPGTFLKRLGALTKADTASLEIDFNSTF
ncbi:hypothetical protein WJX81_006806 [Elliptochloris bilobata]|uniref:SM/Sec1-family protein n=1 Tax=Elliptochloris bilobata TaxID=381761 RepID=A0AAW1QXI5_9CHLO